eukprot:SAG11_NODE_53_length_19648_cov_14.691902_26_plen_49_part_01
MAAAQQLAAWQLTACRVLKCWTCCHHKSYLQGKAVTISADASTIIVGAA